MMALDTVTVTGLEGVLDTLKRLPPEIVSKRGGPVKTALRKAAQVIQRQAQANVRQIVITPNQGGLPSDSTGLLEKSIIVSRDPRPQQSGANERYLVRVKRKRYQDQPKVTTGKVGALLETGTERREPMPWMRPAFEMKKNEAVSMFVSTINSEISKIIRKLTAGKA